MQEFCGFQVVGGIRRKYVPFISPKGVGSPPGDIGDVGDIGGGGGGVTPDSGVGSMHTQ